MMKRLCVVAGLVCFLCGGVFADTSFRGVGNWDDPNLWDNGVPVGAIEGKVREPNSVCTLNSSTSAWGPNQRLRVYEGATLLVEEGAELIGAGWMRVGAGNAGTVIQSGGLVQNEDKLGIGDSSGSDGLYEISGGTLTYLPGNQGRLYVGARGGVGQLTIVGTDPTIQMELLVVGERADGDGTIEFVLNADGVSPIIVEKDAVIDEQGDNSTATLAVSAVEAPPMADITLIDVADDGTLAGAFDTVNGAPAVEGALVLVDGGAVVNTYILTYMGGAGNDVVLLYQSSAAKPRIIWVSDNAKYNFEADEPADAGFVDLLRAQGYQVDYKGEAWPYDPNDDDIALNPDWKYWQSLDPNKIDELNAADLVIVSRIASSGAYDDKPDEVGGIDECIGWNSVTTPMISMNAHLARSGYGKWGWHNTSGHPYTTDNVHTILDPAHAIFAGIEIDPNGQADLLTDDYTVNGSDPADADAGNGVTLATRASDNAIMISAWEAGVEYFDGAGYVAGGARMFFAAGSGNGSPRDGLYDLTADGETVFLNAVTYMLKKNKEVVWVSFHPADDTPSGGAAGAGFTEAPDKVYTDLIAAEGYTVTRYLTTGTPDVDLLNAADLVIIGRSVSSGNYSNDAATTWNGVSTPMIVTSGYTLRSSRMGYTTGTDMPDITGDITLTVSDPTHPIFAGVALTDGTMDNPFGGVVVYPTDGTTLARGISINNNPVNTEGTVLAVISEASTDAGPAGAMVIGEWPAGAALTHNGGAGTDVLAGPRLVFLSGSREAEGISSETAGIFDLYTDGAQMFMNAVTYMLDE